MPPGTGPKPRIPLPKNPEVEVVWHGALVSPTGEKGQLLPETHTAGSTWEACVNKLRERITVINRRELDG